MNVWYKFLELWGPKESTIEVMSLTELNGWVHQEIATHFLEKNYQQELQMYHDTIKDKTWILSVNLEELIQKSPSFAFEREAEFVSQQIKKLNRKLNEIEKTKQVQETNDSIIAELPGTISVVQKHLLSLTTEHPFYSLLTAMIHELHQIQTTTSSFEAYLEKIGFRKIQSITTRFEFLLTRSQKKKQIQEAVEKMKERLQEVEQQRNEKNNEMKELKQDPLFIEYIQQIKEKKEKQQETQQGGTKLLDYFSKIKPALEKFHAIQPNHLVSMYITNPIRAIEEDQSHAIHHSIQHCRALLSNGQIQLPLETMHDIVGTIDSTNVTELYRQYFTKSRHTTPLSRPPISAKIEEVKYRLHHFDTQCEKLADRILLLDEKVTELDEALIRDIHFFETIIMAVFNKTIHVSA